MDVPISLYLKTKQGDHPDLRVVAKAALTFAEIIESVARSLDPDLEIQVEVVSGTEGSFGLNTLNRIKDGAGKAKQGVLAGWRKHEKLRFLACYVAIKILDNGFAWTQDHFMDWMSSDDAPQEVRLMSPQERRDLAADIASELRKQELQDKVDQLYGQVSKDSRIEAIGVTAAPKPAQKLLFRSEFADTEIQPEDTDRVTSQRFEATLVSPVLEFGSRRWKLRGPFGEFGAPISDKEFLQKAITGETALHLQGGVILDVDVATHERLIDGVWTIQLRTIDKVHGWREGPVQEELLPSGA